ncbi:hypothetical protein HDU80_011221 [Chytriomyces hyalinus]|nr:hypothetical protein HDU80_011221 [Chytriomyces hyalinus]
MPLILRIERGDKESRPIALETEPGVAFEAVLDAILCQFGVDDIRMDASLSIFTKSNPPIQISSTEHLTSLLQYASSSEWSANDRPSYLCRNTHCVFVDLVVFVQQHHNTLENALAHHAENVEVEHPDSPTDEYCRNQNMELDASEGVDETRFTSLDETSINFDDFEDSASVENTLKPKDVIEILQDINYYICAEVSPVKSWVSKEKNLIPLSRLPEAQKSTQTRFNKVISSSHV